MHASYHACFHRRCSWSHFITTGRAHASGDHFNRVTTGTKTPAGLGELFATHVVGHYVLVESLLPQLVAAGDARVIWTSSRASCRSAFSWDDVQCTGTDDPYGASKFAVDATAVGLSGRLQKSGVSTALVCPGYVLTQMTRGYSWFVMLAVCARIAVR